jgi:shikimate dehydrogenase
MRIPDSYAVFGCPIKHSQSPRIHQLFAQQTGQHLLYTAQEVPAAQFQNAATAFFRQGGKGLNCTVPLKELAWQFADQLSERAKLAKAVNTLALQADGSLWGDNTDGVGLMTDLTVNQRIDLMGRRVLILGAGGATRGILSPLLALQPAHVVIANRTVAKAQQLVSEFAAFNANLVACGFAALAGHQFDVILNATAASLSGELPPLPANLLADNGCCYDLAYGKQTTAFVRWGQQQAAACSVDGLGMLVEQAAEAFYHWRGVRPLTQPVIALLTAERNRNDNPPATT